MQYAQHMGAPNVGKLVFQLTRTPEVAVGNFRDRIFSCEVKTLLCVVAVQNGSLCRPIISEAESTAARATLHCRRSAPTPSRFCMRQTGVGGLGALRSCPETWL